jgi:alkylation response protein AidB-like acyl-CoA dehydrogenase
MDFDFSAEEQAWRVELREFFSSELPDEFAGDSDGGSDRHWEFSRSFTKRLAEKGWLAIGWPKEYGGMGAGHINQMIFNEEVGYFRAPDPGGIGIRFIGPALMVLGTEEQKQQYLPGIIAGEDVWCQGFSEPGSGSDLASLQTRAVAEGDHFVVNGSKIWTSHAHRANYGYLAVRTDPEAPKHRGITLMALDMQTPGVSLRPLIDMAGHHPFNETFLEDVRIPRESVIGEIDRGWYAMATTLDFERSGIRGVSSTRRVLQLLLDSLQKTQADDTRVVLDATRHTLADRVIENEVNRLMAYLVVSMQAHGLVPNHEASTTKLLGADISQRVSNTAVKMYGLYGQLHPDSAWTVDRGESSQHYLRSVSASIAGGTNEIQRNVIATRGLGLPRS